MAFYTKAADYLKDSYQEMKRVVWPSRKQVIQHTILVIVFSAVIAAFLMLLDLAFQQGVQRVLDWAR